MVAPPNPRTWVNGEYVSDATLNGPNGIRDALRFLLDPPRCKCRQTAAQSIPTGTWTPVTFTTEDYDNEATAAYLSGTGMHDPATNPSRVVAQTAGSYLVTAIAYFATSSAGARGAKLTVNGVVLPNSQILVGANPTATRPTGVPTTNIISLSVGDYVELQAFQDSGGALSTTFGTDSGSLLIARWIGL
jgi:hypothetical protein